MEKGDKKKEWSILAKNTIYPHIFRVYIFNLLLFIFYPFIKNWSFVTESKNFCPLISIGFKHDTMEENHKNDIGTNNLYILYIYIYMYFKKKELISIKKKKR